VTVTFTATDSCGNVGTATKDFTVNDTTKPVVTVPAGTLALQCLDPAAVAAWAATASALDNCGGTPAVAPSYTARPNNCNQTVTVTFTARTVAERGDGGRRISRSTTRTKPVVTVPAGTLALQCLDPAAVAAWAATASALDNCGGTPAVAPSYTAPANNCNQTVTVTFTATDSCGNVGTATKDFTVNDTTKPVVTVPAGTLALQCLDPAAVAALGGHGQRPGNCGGTPAVAPSYTAPANNCKPDG